MHIYKYIFTCVQINVHICICTCVNICMYVHIYVYIYIYTCIDIQVLVQVLYFIKGTLYSTKRVHLAMFVPTLHFTAIGQTR